MQPLIFMLNALLMLQPGVKENIAPGKVTCCTYDESDRKRIATDILNNLVKENYEAVRKDFHASLKQNLPTERISEGWIKLVETIGAYKEVISTTPDVAQSYNQVKIRCRFENGNSSVEVTFNEDDKVIGLFLKP